MVIYEVNIVLEPQIEEEYRAWLGLHVEAVLSHEGFIEADIFDVKDGREQDDGKVCLSVHYHLRSEKDLEDYLRDHAPTLRQEASERFGNRFSSWRRVLHKTGF